MIGNTLALTIDGVLYTLKLINEEGFTSKYRFTDATHRYDVSIRHSTTKATASQPTMDRHNFELRETIWATESASEKLRVMYFVIQQTPDDLSTVNANAAFDLAIASSDAFLTSLMGWES
jgi:hypothetical protein